MVLYKVVLSQIGQGVSGGMVCYDTMYDLFLATYGKHYVQFRFLSATFLPLFVKLKLNLGYLVVTMLG